MDLKLKGRVALVTGGSRGIGRSIAVALLEEGADVVICGRGRGSFDEAKREIETKYHDRIHAVPANVKNNEEIRRLFDYIRSHLGRLDILVNNVGGVEKFGRFPDLSDEDWMDAFNFNFLSMVRCTREALPLLRSSDNARVINIASVAGRQPGANNPHYGAAKAAMIFLSKSLATNFGKDNITVNAICPSTIKGGIWERDVKDKAQRLGVSESEAELVMEKEVKMKLALPRIGHLKDVASLVAFLASPEAGFITGTCISVDGGLVKSIF